MNGWTRMVRPLWPALAALALLLAGCGGGGDAPPPPAPPAGTVIGAAGGTVTGPNGAQVVIPAGALSANTTINVAQSAAGAPALPAGLAAVGQTYVFTPHGTAFAMPVTVTIPFAAASVPAGAQPVLYQTSGAGGWSAVPGATVAAGTVTAQVSSFSWFVVTLSPPQITQQPQNQSVAEGAAASFSVTALGAPPFTYQWQRSDDGGAMWTNVGANAREYTTTATKVADDNGARFRVIVRNADGEATSAAATLTVTAMVVPPAITTQPQNQSVAVGATATFSCAASGTSVAYQWQRSTDNGVTFTNIAGATNASYTTPATAATDNGHRFRCVASNSAGSATSNAATLTVTSTPPAGTGARLAAGKQHSLAVPANGTLQSWGVVSDFLEIGRVPPPAGNVPGAVPYFTVVPTGKVRAVAAGQWHSVAVTETGTAHSFGYGLFGQLGTGTIGGAPTGGVQVRFTNGTAVTDAVDVCAGQHHSFLVRKVQVFGQVVRQAWGFGANGEGQLGDGTSLNRFGPSPTTFGAFDPPLLSIACGWNHMLAVMADNTVRAWGSNLRGQLGANNIASASTLPVPVVTDASGTLLRDVIAVAGGETHSLALKNDGTVWAWGSNANGKLGDGTETDPARPVQVLTAPGTPLTGIVAIAAGGEFSLALDNQGAVYAWGINEVGQLGNGSASPGFRAFAAQVLNLTSGVVAIVAGRNGGLDHALALKSDGTVWAWGYDLEGQLGIGNPNQVIYRTPTQVPGLNLN